MSRKASPEDRIAEIWQVGPDRFKMRTPFDPGFLFEFRKRVPAKHRKWLPDEKVWVFELSNLSDVGRLCSGYFDSVDVRLLNTIEPSSSEPSPWELLLRLAPPEAVKRLWREAVKITHPDNGGTSAQMIVLQKAWEEIRGKLSI